MGDKGIFPYTYSGSVGPKILCNFVCLLFLTGPNRRDELLGRAVSYGCARGVSVALQYNRFLA